MHYILKNNVALDILYGWLVWRGRKKEKTMALKDTGRSLWLLLLLHLRQCSNSGATSQEHDSKIRESKIIKLKFVLGEFLGVPPARLTTG